MHYVQSCSSDCKKALTASDQDHLLNALAEGDRTVFWPLWQINHQYLYRRCLQWMNYRRHDAEEALSRAMVRAWEKLPRYAHQIQNLRGWLSRLTYHVCIDFYRETDRISYSLDDSNDSLCPYDKLPTNLEGPEHSLHRNELSKIIQSAIANLPERLREPCRLRLCENWTYRQLADHFQLTEPTARKRIQQARTILRRRISQYLQGQFTVSFDALTDFNPLNAA